MEHMANNPRKSTKKEAEKVLREKKFLEEAYQKQNKRGDKGVK